MVPERVRSTMEMASGVVTLQTVDEAGLQPGFRHGLGDGLAAAVDDHGVEAQDFQQNDVAHELLDQAGVVHGAAARI